MLLARKICETEIPAFAQHNEPHDSFYIGSDVFYTYIVSNGLLASSHPPADERRIFQRCQRTSGTPSDRTVSFQYPGKVFKYAGILRAKSDHRPAPPAFWKTDSATPLPENMTLYSVSIREVRRSGWKSLNMLCGRSMPALWITPLWNTVFSAVLTPKMSRWRFSSRESPAQDMGIILCRAPPASVTATVPTNGCPDMDASAGMLRIVMGLGTKSRGPDIGRLSPSVQS